MSEDAYQPDDDQSQLDDQLDDLLSRIEQAEPGTVPGGEPKAQVGMEAPGEGEGEAPAADGDALDAMIDRQVDDAIAAAEQVTATADAEADQPAEADSAAEPEQAADGALAAQVDAMLDEAQSQEAEQAEVLEGSFESPDTVHEPEPAAEAHDAQVDEPADVAELDRTLAEEAAHAVAGDFETPDQVMDARAAALAELDEASASEADDAPASPEHAQTSGASAQDVAAELDDQPQQQAEVSDDAPVAVDAGRAEADAAAASGALPRMSRAALHACAAVNAPLGYLDDEWRRAVGYAGILTVLSALLLILLGVVT